MADTASFDYTPHNHVGRIHVYLTSRGKDVTDLMGQIFAANKVAVIEKRRTLDGEYFSTADLGYCKVSFDARAESPYRVINVAKGTHDDCDDLAHVLEVILRKWW